MRDYAVYAIGNALVDLEYQVNEQDLARLGIDKGVMTLVDRDRQQQIMRHLRDHHPQRGAGGSAANSVIAVGQFGGKGFYSCKVANDELGQFYLADLAAGGIDTPTGGELESGDTGRCVVLVTPDTDRTMCTYLGVSSALSQQELDAEAIRGARFCYVEGYLATSDSARAAAIQARQIAEGAAVKTALSLSDPNIVGYFRNQLLEMIGDGLDLVFANEAEAKGMAQTDQLDDAIVYLKGIAREFALTLGPKGALVFDGQRLIEIEPVPVDAVDTLGAGDLFAGAVLYGLSQDWEHQRAADLAAAASAQLVTRFGPRLSQEESRAVLRRFSD